MIQEIARPLGLRYNHYVSPSVAVSEKFITFELHFGQSRSLVKNAHNS